MNLKPPVPLCLVTWSRHTAECSVCTQAHKCTGARCSFRFYLLLPSLFMDKETLLLLDRRVWNDKSSYSFKKAFSGTFGACRVWLSCKQGSHTYENITTMPSSALTKTQKRGLLAKCLWFHIVGAIIVSLGLQVSKNLLWLNQERRFMQISTEIMILWKILRQWGRPVSFRV